MKKSKKDLWTGFGLLLLVAILSGGFAGIVSSVYTNQSLNEYAASLENRERLFTISQVKPRPLPGTYEEALTQVQEEGWPALALVRPVSEDGDSMLDWITADDVYGVGTVITSDGWVLFDGEVFASFVDPVEDAEVWVSGARYDVTEIVEDTQSKYVLVKVDAQSLSTLAFGQTSEMAGGDLLFATPGSSDVVPTSLQDGESIRALVHTAETHGTSWELTSTFDAPVPLLNSSAELVGFVNEGVTATPLHHIRPFIQTVLRYNELRYAGVGAYMVSVHDVLNIDAEITNHTTFGELIVAPSRFAPAVLADSPADQVGIVEGDVIIAVDGVLITETESFAEILYSYEPNDRAVLEILRDGEFIEQTITFGNLDDLIY